MASLRNLCKFLTNSLILRIPQQILRKIEEKSQFFQGTGWGAATTDAEVEAVLFLLNRKGVTDFFALDIGANIGDWTNSFTQRFPLCRVVAFEPGATAFKAISTRFQNQPHIKCVNLGLSDQNAEVTLFSDSDASGLSSIHQRRLDHFSISLNIEEVIRVVTLDSWIETSEENAKPTILKLDIEGHELSALLGAQKTLRDIKIVQFEFGGGNIDSKSYFQDFWYFFIDLGFDLYRLTPRGPILVPKYSETLEVFRPTNYFAVRR